MEEDRTLVMLLCIIMVGAGLDMKKLSSSFLALI